MRDEGTRRGEGRGSPEERSPGILVTDARVASEPRIEPRIAAFIWGGKVRPTPTLPYGRWKGAA